MTYRVVAFNIIDFNVDTAALTQVTPRKSFWTGANYSKRYTPIFGNSLTKATLYANTRWPMDELVELTRYTAAEESAEKYLKERGILKSFHECPYCHGKGKNRVRRAKYKCYSCNREWGVRRGSILEGLRAPFSKFLMAIIL